MYNSKEYEFADIRVIIFGAQLSGLRGITFKKSQEKEHVYGAGNQPKSIQRGNKKYEGTLTVLKSDFDRMNVAARASGYEDITDVPFTQLAMTVVFDNPGIGLTTHNLIGVEFTDMEDGMKQGDMSKEVELPFIFLRLQTKP